MQSRVGKMENQMNQTFEEMSKLTRENRKLRKTLRSRSATPSRRRKEASDSEEEEEEESEGESEDSGEESEETEPMSSERGGGVEASLPLQVEGEGTQCVSTHVQGEEAQRALPAHDVGPAAGHRVRRLFRREG